MILDDKGTLQTTKEAISKVSTFEHINIDHKVVLVLLTYVSALVIGAELQQIVIGEEQITSFLSWKLWPAQCTCSTFGRELPAVYLETKALSVQCGRPKLYHLH